MLKDDGWGQRFCIKEVEATETPKQYQYIEKDGNWESKGRINKADMINDAWAGDFDRYVGLSREAVIKRFISKHEDEVSRLKKKVENEEDCITAAKKLLETQSEGY